MPVPCPSVDTVTSLLREHRAELEKLGLRRVAVFGSTVRGEAQPGSDIDVLVEFRYPVGFFRFLDVKAYLETLLGRPVDLVTQDALKRQLRDAILREAVYAI